ncbi:hypothetical protein T492DRAFT_403075 [Pavlovales sp. CCMP2436]|nr:hypothetical protein T492DRAFT_403075 [Pavlovales sp. CCMP2436]
MKWRSKCGHVLFANADVFRHGACAEGLKFLEQQIADSGVGAARADRCQVDRALRIPSRTAPSPVRAWGGRGRGVREDLLLPDQVQWPGLASTADEAPAADEVSSSGEDARPHPRGILQTAGASFIGLLLAKFQRYGTRIVGFHRSHFRVYTALETELIAILWHLDHRSDHDDSLGEPPSKDGYNGEGHEWRGLTVDKNHVLCFSIKEYAWREGKLVHTGRYHSLLVAAGYTPMQLAGTRDLFIGKLMHLYVARGSGSFEKILGSGCHGAALFHLPLDSGLTPGLLAEFHPNGVNGGHSGRIQRG